MKKNSLSKIIRGTCGIALFIALWQLLSGFYTPEQWPRPLDVLKALLELYENGQLQSNIAVSMFRFLSGYLLAVSAALPAGIVLGRCITLADTVNPVTQILRPISPIAWFPLAVLWFGIGSMPAVFIIFLSAFFPILLSTISAVGEVPETYLKVSRNFGMSRTRTICAVILPAAFPTIVIGLRIAVGTAWIHLVAGEMLGAQSGLGFLIVDARNFLRTDMIIGGMLTVGIIGLAIDVAVRNTEKLVKRNWGY